VVDTLSLTGLLIPAYAHVQQFRDAYPKTVPQRPTQHEMSGSAYDVIVVGAGPAGSGTAALLAYRGLRVLLLDRAAFPRDKPCAEYLSPETGRILDRLGVLAGLRAQAEHLVGMRIVSPNGTEFTGRFSGAAPYRGFSDRGLAVRRTVLDHALVKMAVKKGATLRERTRVESVELHATHRAVQVRDDTGTEVLTARLVVGADGLNSRVASDLQLVRRGKPQRHAFVTHYRGVADIGDVGEMHVGRGGYVGLARVEKTLTNVAVVLDAAMLPDGASAEARFDAAVQRFPAVAARLAAASREGTVSTAGPFARSTTRATADRAVLVGDAADFYDPFTGEGVYAALHGAELIHEHLSELIENDTLEAKDLAVYDRARRRAFGGKWRVERLIGVAISHPRLLDHAAARLARRRAMADLLVGVTGDFVPPRAVLRPGFLLRLVV
jgi:geranylgeranyl reductase family protein